MVFFFPYFVVNTFFLVLFEGRGTYPHILPFGCTTALNIVSLYYVQMEKRLKTRFFGKNKIENILSRFVKKNIDIKNKSQISIYSFDKKTRQYGIDK